MAGEKGYENVEGEEGGVSSPQFEETPRMDISEEEIMKKLTIAQMKERLMQQLQQIEEEEKQLTEKVQNAKDAIFKEMEEKYSLTEKEFRNAFRDIQRKEEIEKKIMDTIKQKGKDAWKEIKEDAERLRGISIIENMEDSDIKKISVYIEDARKYMEKKQIEQGKQQIHHRGRMSTEALMMLKYVKEQGGRIQWKELLQYAKEELGLDGDTTNKRRWNLLTKEYIRREGNELVLTQKGYARLREEGY